MKRLIAGENDWKRFVSWIIFLQCAVFLLFTTISHARGQQTVNIDLTLASSIQSSLNAGNNYSVTSSGDIVIGSAIVKNSGVTATLSLTASGVIFLDENVTCSAGTLNLELNGAVVLRKTNGVSVTTLGGNVVFSSVINSESSFYCPLTIDASNGSVIFNGAVGNTFALKYLTVTAATTAINGGSVITNSGGGLTQSYSGNITLGSANTVLTMFDTPQAFTIVSGKSIANSSNGDATLAIKSTAPVILDANSTITSPTGKLNLILWSDIDGNGGYFRMNSGSTISTNGGHIWIGGGSGSVSWNGLTVGNGYALNASSVGVLLSSPNMNSGGGDIYIAGESTSGLTNSHGIFISSGTIESSGGTISLIGQGGTCTNTPANCDGIRIDGVVSTTSGNINMRGNSTAYSQSEGIAIEASGRIRSSAGGNIIVEADIYYMDAASQIQSTGSLQIKPTTNTTTIGLAGGAGTLQLPSAYFSANFIDGFGDLIIGSDNQTGNITLNNITFRDPTRLKTAPAGKVTINASQTVSTAAGVKLTFNKDVELKTGAKIIK